MSFNVRVFVLYRYRIEYANTLNQVSYYCTVSFIFFVLCVTLLYSIPVISKCCQKRKTGTRRRQLINELISCVGGGALLGLALLDVLPELRERIEEETEVFYFFLKTKYLESAWNKFAFSGITPLPSCLW